MVSRNSFKFVMLPPQTETTRGWAKRLAEAVPEVRVVLAEDADTAAREIADAEAAFGWLGKELLSKATNLRWLQAPQAAPAAGYYYPELTSHRVRVTNFREIYNDHIGAHILAFVLAFARGLCTCSFRNNCAASGRRARWRLAMSCICPKRRPWSLA